MIIVSLGLLIIGLINENATVILASGLFAIASSIDSFCYKYFKRR